MLKYLQNLNTKIYDDEEFNSGLLCLTDNQQIITYLNIDIYKLIRGLYRNKTNYLNLSNMFITDDMLVSIFFHIHYSESKNICLNLSGNKITTNGFFLLCKLINITNKVVGLKLDTNKIKLNSLIYGYIYRLVEKLEYFTAYHTDIYTDVEGLKIVKKCVKNKELYVDKVGNIVVYYVVKNMELFKSVECIKFKSSRLDNHNFMILLDELIKNGINIKEIILENEPLITDDSIDKFSEYVGINKNIRSISLIFTKITNIGVEKICDSLDKSIENFYYRSKDVIRNVDKMVDLINRTYIKNVYVSVALNDYASRRKIKRALNVPVHLRKNN
jgi:hypothetical protein